VDFAGGSVRATRILAKIEDGIADELSGAVEGDIAAAVALEELDAASDKGFGGSEDVGGFGVAAESDDGRVLDQEEDVADLFLFAQIDQLLLEAQAFGVVEGSELDDGNHGWGQLYGLGGRGRLGGESMWTEAV
jgi:hypothetical protein